MGAGQGGEGAEDGKGHGPSRRGRDAGRGGSYHNWRDRKPLQKLYSQNCIGEGGDLCSIILRPFVTFSCELFAQKDINQYQRLRIIRCKLILNCDLSINTKFNCVIQISNTNNFVSQANKS